MSLRATAAVLLISTAAQGAEITRVASSFEPNDPFGMFADVSYLPLMQRGKIVREWYQDMDSIDVTELRYQLVEHRLQGDVHLGIYRDVEFHFGIPIVIAADRSWNFAVGTGPSNSTIINNCQLASGEPIPPAAPMGSSRGCQVPQPLFDIDPDKGINSYRSGLGDLTFGLAWAPLNQKKDDSAPTWVLRFDYTAPVAEAIDPFIITTTSAKGPIGDRVHRYKFATAISKRIAFAEPYFSLHYTLPWRGPGFYSNCNNASPDRMAKPDNCTHPEWKRDETGVRPPHVGGFIFGSEFNAFESSNRHQKLALDLRFGVTYVSEGRYYNEMSDPLQKLLYSGDYVHLTGQLGVIGHAAEFVHLKFYGEFGYMTDHTLTSENIGKDFVVETGSNMTSGAVDITNHPEEINPNFDYRIDRAGRRFRIQEELTVKGVIQVSFNF